ncbi:hypothetical protein [Pseudoalteromonas atlantica]|uniref:hypothetical protein n=1 Tax=Pseudoalteromonas atlantica TaxID=288 RepID=UPI00373633AA
MFDVIIQGPIDNDTLEEFYNDMDFNVIDKVIYSDCNNVITLKKEKLRVLTHIDPGQNVGDYKKPLNINRFLTGIKNSLSESSTDNVLIVRSDIKFSLELLLNNLDYNKLNVLDVTTKKFWLKPKWQYHFCDWLYFGKKSKIEMMINSTDYNMLPAVFDDSLYPCSPEYILTYNYLKSNNLLSSKILNSVHIIFSEAINLKSKKKEYNEIPFGINKVYGIEKTDIKNMGPTNWTKSIFYSILLKVKAKIIC